MLYTAYKRKAQVLTPKWILVRYRKRTVGTGGHCWSHCVQLSFLSDVVLAECFNEAELIGIAHCDIVDENMNLKTYNCIIITTNRIYDRFQKSITKKKTTYLGFSFKKSCGILVVVHGYYVKIIKSFINVSDDF